MTRQVTRYEGTTTTTSTKHPPPMLIVIFVSGVFFFKGRKLFLKKKSAFLSLSLSDSADQRTFLWTNREREGSFVWAGI